MSRFVHYFKQGLEHDTQRSLPSFSVFHTFGLKNEVGKLDAFAFPSSHRFANHSWSVKLFDAGVQFKIRTIFVCLEIKR